MASERRRVARGALLAALLCYVTPAWAEPDASQKEHARSLMAEGRELRERRDLQGALVRFQSANEIMGVPTTAYEVAATQAELSLLVEARATLRRLLTIPAREDEPEPFQAARAKATQLDAALAQRIGGVRVVVQGVAPASVELDGERLPASALNQPLRLNPGRHRVVVRTSSQQQTREVDVPERAIVPLTFQLEPQPETGAAPAAESPAAAAAATSAARAPGSPIPALAYVGGGVALVGLVVGSSAGLAAISKKHAAEANCAGDQCPPAAWGDLDSAHDLAMVSTFGFVAFGVGAALGVGALVFGRRASPTTASLQLVARPRHVSIAGSF